MDTPSGTSIMLGILLEKVKIGVHWRIHVWPPVGMCFLQHLQPSHVYLKWTKLTFALDSRIPAMYRWEHLVFLNHQFVLNIVLCLLNWVRISTEMFCTAYAAYLWQLPSDGHFSCTWQVPVICSLGILLPLCRNCEWYVRNRSHGISLIEEPTRFIFDEKRK